ncbi:hypothetical protein B0H19DRAFT_596765 [Mycena capillaripes]|nr:hypothetical protein B0H19DRAFT_596765 [Mycena capillaripes]
MKASLSKVFPCGKETKDGRAHKELDTALTRVRDLVPSGHHHSFSSSSLCTVVNVCEPPPRNASTALVRLSLRMGRRPRMYIYVRQSPCNQRTSFPLHSSSVDCAPSMHLFLARGPTPSRLYILDQPLEPLCIGLEGIPAASLQTTKQHSFVKLWISGVLGKPLAYCCLHLDLLLLNRTHLRLQHPDLFQQLSIRLVGFRAV